MVRVFRDVETAVTANRVPRTSSPQRHAAGVTGTPGQQVPRPGKAVRGPRRVGSQAASSGCRPSSLGSAVLRGQNACSGQSGAIALPQAQLSMPQPRSALRAELLTLPSAIKQASRQHGTSKVTQDEHLCFLQQLHSFIIRPFLTAASRAGWNPGDFFFKLKNTSTQ